MTLRVIVSCDGLRPAGTGETCRGWFPTHVDPSDIGGEEWDPGDVAMDEAAAQGWSFPGVKALCPACTKWRVEHPDEEEKVLGYKPNYGLPRVGGWVPVEVYSPAHGQRVLGQQRALVDAFATELGVPACVLAHAWSDWMYLAPADGSVAPYWERRCQREVCRMTEVQAA